MKRRHVAVVTLMGNGHLYPVLPLAAELADRGYRVSCPINRQFAHRMQAVGAEAVVYADGPVDEALRSENEARSLLTVSDPSRLETSDLEWSYVTRSTADVLSQVSEFYKQDPPDLVLYNRYSIAGRIIAHRFGALAIQFSPHFAYPGRSRFWRDGDCHNPQGMVSYGKRLDSLLATYHFPTQENLWHIEGLNIHLIPKEFQYRHEMFDDRFFFAGSLLRRPFESAWGRSVNCKPLVLISGYSGLPETKSSDTEYFKLLVEALADKEYHCVVSIGETVSVESLGPLPSNFEINHYASHLEILPHASLFVCHGGMGSSLEALHHGVPVLAIPGSPYTQEVAYRVAELGVGSMLPRDELRVDSIRNEISKMWCNPSLHERVKMLQRVFQRSAGAAGVVQRIERYLNESQSNCLVSEPEQCELQHSELAHPFFMEGTR
jgi:MGT family glycosyltransferase